jgi:hypothetical protein
MGCSRRSVSLIVSHMSEPDGFRDVLHRFAAKYKAGLLTPEVLSPANAPAPQVPPMKCARNVAWESLEWEIGRPHPSCSGECWCFRHSGQALVNRLGKSDSQISTTDLAQPLGQRCHYTA